MKNTTPRRVGIKRFTGHPAYLYFRLIEKGKSISVEKLPNPHTRLTFSHR
jgi:hypothetical protein